MSTITLSANKINMMPLLIIDSSNAVKKYKTEMQTLKSKVLAIDSSVCNVEDVISSIKASSQTQEDKIEALDTLNKDMEEFISDVARIDSNAADAINKSKDDFYDKYKYLKPDCEKSWLEVKVDNACEWCKEHWKEILITVTIVIGAVLAIVAVVATGGMALVPLLTTVLTTFGVSAGLATTIATITSISVAAIAILSTLGSSTLNIIDTWGNIDNSVFNTFQNVLNWTSTISNCFYSIGSIYSSVKGISNSSLREYGKSWFGNPEFRNAIYGARNYNFILSSNTSTFWAGLGKDGADVAKSFANTNGRTTLEKTIEELGINMPEWSSVSGPAAWRSASASIAMNSSGETLALLGQDVGKIMSWGEIGSVWLHTESVLLNVNPMVTSVSKLVNFGTINQLLISIPRTFEFSSGLSGLFSLTGSIINWIKEN